MKPIEINRLDENGNVKSASLPALHQPGVGTVPGPDVIVGELIGLVQLDNGAVNGKSASPWALMPVTKGPRRGVARRARQSSSVYSAEPLSNERRR